MGSRSFYLELAASETPYFNSTYLCQDVYQVPLLERCQFVRMKCDSESLIPYFALYHCHIAPYGALASAAYLGILGMLVAPLLFNLMGDAADLYFAPIATTVMRRVPGLTPRLAAVTLVAIGGGVADISADTVAISQGDPALAAGALTGTAMFVQCIVLGELIRMNGGIPCGPAMMFDALAWCMAVTLLLSFFSVGVMNHTFVALALVLYGLHFTGVVGSEYWGGKKSEAGPTEASTPGHKTPTEVHQAGESSPLLGNGLTSRAAQQEGADDAASDSSGDLPFGLSTALSDDLPRLRRPPVAMELGDMPRQPSAVMGASGAGSGSPGPHAVGGADPRWLLVLEAVAPGQQLGWAEQTPLYRYYRATVVMLLLPVLTAMRLSIPAAYDGAYQPAWLSASMAGMALLYAVRLLGMTDTLQLVLMLAAGIVAGCMSFFFLRGTRRLPSCRMWGVPWAPLLACAFGFLACMLWLEMLADEAVAALQLVASLAHLPPGVIGLTLIAWGNGADDFFSFKAMAHQGQLTTALAACYSSAVLDLTVSMALGYAVLFARHHVTFTAVHANPEMVLGCVSLILYNVTLVTVGWLHNWQLPHSFHRVAWGWYAAYVVLAFIVGFSSWPSVYSFLAVLPLPVCAGLAMWCGTAEGSCWPVGARAAPEAVQERAGPSQLPWWAALPQANGAAAPPAARARSVSMNGRPHHDEDDVP